MGTTEPWTSFLPGDGHAFVTSTTLLLAFGLTADGSTTAPDVATAWQLVRAEGEFADIVGWLTTSYDDREPTVTFGLTRIEGMTIRVAVSGAVAVDLVPPNAAPVVISDSVTTDGRFPLPTEFTVRGTGVQSPAVRLPFEVRAGVVPATALHRQAVAASHPTEDDATEAVRESPEGQLGAAPRSGDPVTEQIFAALFGTAPPIAREARTSNSMLAQRPAGSPLPPPQPQDRPGSAVVPTGGPAVTGKGGGVLLAFSSGERVPVVRSTIIGRNPRIDGPVNGEFPGFIKLSSAGKGLSRSHAQLLVADGRIVISDLESANGVLVIRDGIETDLEIGEAVELTIGTRVDLGGAVQFTVEALP